MKNLVILLISLFLYGCATQPVFKIAKNPKQSWANYQAQANIQHNWDINGAIGIATKDQAVNANFNWLQKYKYFKINIYGPLGADAVEIYGNIGDKVTLIAKNKTYTADNTAELMMQQLGWFVPINGLIYWIRGLIEPNHLAMYKLNIYGFLAELKQQRWNVKYPNYMLLENNIDMPQKIILTRKELKITLVINSYKLINAKHSNV